MPRVKRRVLPLPAFRGRRRGLAVAAAAALVVLTATACAIGGGPNRQATAAQKSTGTSGAPVRAAEATVLDLTFSPSAGTGLVARFSLRCDRDARFLALAKRICESLAQREGLLLPRSMTACPLPTGVFVLTVKGTIGGDEIDRFYAPCSRAERTAIATWMSLLQFTPGPL
jgi:hypothetical protein